MGVETACTTTCAYLLHCHTAPRKLQSPGEAPFEEKEWDVLLEDESEDDDRSRRAKREDASIRSGQRFTVKVSLHLEACLVEADALQACHCRSNKLGGLGHVCSRWRFFRDS